ncbi:MAG: hypothetical protein ACOX5G_07875 [Kiritimatiellia bacterium]
MVVDGKKKTRDLPNEERAEWFKRRFRQDIATTAKKNGLALWRVHDEFTRVKGGKVTIKQGDSFAAEVARGDDVISFVDPPYVDTTGYEGYERRVGKDGAVSFEKVKPESHGVALYRRTASLLERIRAAGHAMVYTDETFTFEKTDGDGDGAAKRPDVLAQALPIYLRIARNFDRIGSVSKAIGAGRKETIGIRAGGYEDESGQQAGGGEVSDDVAAGGGRGAGLAGAAPAAEGAGGGVDAAGQAAGASAEAGGGGEVVRLRLPGSVRAGDRRGEPQPEGEDRVGQDGGSSSVILGKWPGETLRGRPSSPPLEVPGAVDKLLDAVLEDAEAAGIPMSAFPNLPPDELSASLERRRSAGASRRGGSTGN